MDECGFANKTSVLFCGAAFLCGTSLCGTTFKSVDKIQSLTIQMKATKQHFSVAMFIMLDKVVLTFESADEIL